MEALCFLPTGLSPVFHREVDQWIVYSFISYGFQSCNKAQGSPSGFIGLHFGLNGPGHHQSLNTCPLTFTERLSCEFHYTCGKLGKQTPPHGSCEPCPAPLTLSSSWHRPTEPRCHTALQKCIGKLFTSQISKPKMSKSFFFWKCQLHPQIP